MKIKGNFGQSTELIEQFFFQVLFKKKKMPKMFGIFFFFSGKLKTIFPNNLFRLIF